MESELQRGRADEGSFIRWLTPPKSVMARLGWVLTSNPQAYGLSDEAFPDVLTGSWIRNGAAMASAGIHTGCWHHGQQLNTPHHNTIP